MTRYVKQRDETGCGPVVIINTFKWMGYKVTYDFIHVARALCGWTDGRYGNGGTFDAGLEKALKYLKIKKKRKIKPTLKEVDKHLDNGGAVVISYFHPFTIPMFAKKDAGHFTLCVGRTKSSYTLINDSKKTVMSRPRAVVKAMLNHKVDGYKCWTWFISK